jgi:ligand-binding sensor domain-containing protein
LTAAECAPFAVPVVAAVVQNARAELQMDTGAPPDETKNVSKLGLAGWLRCIFSCSTKMKAFARLKWRYAAGTLLLLAIGSAGTVFWRAHRALRIAALEVRSEKSLRFSIRQLAPVISNFEWISAPEAFTGGAVFNGEFYLCGASGLFRYDSHGALLKHYRPGQEIPPSPLLQMTAGTLKDAKEPELLIVTQSEGVLAFNGLGFRQLFPADADARSITSLLPLGSGQLLIGTRKRGLLVYDGHSLQAFHPALEGLHVTALAGSEADLWIGTHDQGVVHLQAGRSETFAETEGMPDPQVFSIAVLNDKAYAGTAVGIAEFESGRFARVLAPGSFARTLYGNGSTLLSGGNDEGVLEIDSEPKRTQAVLHPATRAMSDVQQIFAEGETLYVVTRSALYQKEGRHGGWRRVLSPENTMLADRNISALAMDRANRLWVGYFDRGLDLFEPSLRNAVHIEDDNVFCVNRILPNAAGGNMAVATANGLVLFDENGTKRQVLGRADGLLADHVTDAALYGSGMVLATPAGLTFLDAAGARSLYAFHGLVNNHVYAVGASGKEVVAGTLGGISVLESESVAANYTVATRGLTHNWISAIVRTGNEWIVGTYGGGIVRMLANGRFESFDVATGKFEVYPNAMLATDQHVLAGTLNKGLYVFNRATNHWSVITDGLPSLTVTAVAAGNGFIYVGTDNGLVRIAEQNLP